MLSTRRKRARVVDTDDEDESTTPPMDEGANSSVVNLISDDEEPPVKRATLPEADPWDDDDDDVIVPQKKRRTRRRKAKSVGASVGNDDDFVVGESRRSKRRNKRSASMDKAANYSSLTEPSKRRKLRSSTRKRAKSLDDTGQTNANVGTAQDGNDTDKMEVMEISDGSDFVNEKPRKRRPRSQQIQGLEVQRAINSDDCLGERIRSLDTSTVVMSSRKRGEVRLWLESALNSSGPRLLVLHGPPGCGKWSALRALLNEFKLVPVQWEPPIPPARTSVLGAMMDSLESFLVGANYTPLPGAGDTRRVIVLRDLPVSLTDSRIRRERLQEVLGRYAANVRVPSVLLLSDDAKGVARLLRLIGSRVTDAARVIKIPAPSAIATRKALKRVAFAEGLEANSATIDKLAETANGDLRGALNALHLGGACDIGKDGVLDTYHAVSKVLNNKRLDSGESKYDVESVLTEARADPGAFVAFLHENYVDFVSELDDAANALGAVSDADCIMQWDSDAQQRGMLADCAASVATRAFIFYNQSPVRRGWRPIRGPTTFAISTAATEYTEQSRASMLRPGDVVTRASLLETAAYGEKIRNVRLTKWTAGFGSGDADLAMIDAEVRAYDAQATVFNSQQAEFGGRSQEYQVSAEVIVSPAAVSESESIESWGSDSEG